MSFDGCISSLNLKSGSVSREFNMEELKGKTDSHLAESRCGEKSEFAFVTLRTASSRAPDSTVVPSPRKPRGGIWSSRVLNLQIPDFH